MIVPMRRVRIAGPRAQLDAALTAVQDLGVLHVDTPVFELDRAHAPLEPASAPGSRERRHLQRCLADVDRALDRLALAHLSGSTNCRILVDGDAVRRARRIRNRAEAIGDALAAIDRERALLVRYREFLQVFESLAGHELTWPDGQAFYVVLRQGAADALAELRRSLETALVGEVELVHRELSTGELAVLILTSARSAARVSALLTAARVDELPAPVGLGEPHVRRALPAITARLEALPAAAAQRQEERRALAAAEGPWLADVRALLRDRLLRLDARARTFATPHLFILEGWLPSIRLADFEQQLRERLGPEVILSDADDAVEEERAPVALHNPPIFRPFEVLTRTLPLPRYGTIDPTPFVAVFFPALFGLMLGDVGYGVMLAGLAWVLHARSAPDSGVRALSMVALACSSSTIAFGVLFGELFGPLGRVVGLHPVFNREQAAIPFLMFAIALGGAHIVLGLVLSVVSAWRRGHRGKAMGRGVMLAMLVLTALALLAAFEVLPARLFTPFVILVLTGFVLLVALEGIAAVIDLLSTFGHVLSYARIMAIGTASLMLAVVANEMVGAMGSVVVGVIFALLFHLVNFAIGVFSPTIHALRLHYVEFFGEFFTPGGAAYRPLGHWHPTTEH